MSSFQWKNMQKQYKVSSYGNDLHFYDYTLAIEIDENWHIDRVLTIK